MRMRRAKWQWTSRARSSSRKNPATPIGEDSANGRAKTSNYKMKFVYLFLIAWLSLSLHAMPANIIIIRHGEKPKDKNDNHLSPAGWERAERLPEFLKDNPELAKLGAPSALFATHLTKEGHGQRTIE